MTRHVSSFTVAFVVAVLFALSAAGAGKESRPVLKIVNDSLLERGNFYSVKGSVYNPGAKGVKNVVIKYYVWKKWIGQDGHGLRIKETGGLVVAKIKFIPPKQTVEFTTEPSDNAPVMIRIQPDPINAETTAEWDQ